MQPHSEKGLALSSFYYSFLEPVLSDWQRKDDYGVGELRVIQGRLIEAACWLIVGTDYGFFDEQDAQDQLEIMADDLLRECFESKLLPLRSFDPVLLNRIEKFIFTGSTPWHQVTTGNSATSEQSAADWGTVIALAGEFVSNLSVLAFTAALVFPSDRTWEYLSDVRNCDANLILKSRSTSFDLWAGGRAGLVYDGLLRCMQHLERLLDFFSTTDSEAGERLFYLTSLRQNVRDIHTWWFDVVNEHIRVRFEKLSENFGTIAASEIPDGTQARQMFPDYARGLFKRWKDFGRPRAKRTTA